MPARTVRLFHWSAEEARPRIDALREAGYRVQFDSDPSAAFRKLREKPPDALVIDLSRMPMQGRDVAMDVRHRKRTRGLPLVFAGGDPAEVAHIRNQIPDAVYTEWGRIRSSLGKALAHPPERPVAPASPLAGYSGTPLPKKLGIKPGHVVDLAGAPRGFEKTLGDLPEGARLKRGARGPVDVTLWFVKNARMLHDGIRKMAPRGDSGGLWIVWPKQASGVAADVNGNLVRRTGLDAGLVDYKVAAIDATWSGLKFSRRRS